jgi:hypothetical protein
MLESPTYLRPTAPLSRLGTVNEVPVFAKEGWYLFNCSCLDKYKVIKFFGVTH